MKTTKGHGGSGATRITISDVAAAAGVSITTVSHALNGRGQVDAQTRLRVKQAADRLGYRPNRHAQRLRTGEAHMIALISSMPFAVAAGPSRLGFLMEIAAVSAAHALTEGMALVLVPPMESGTLKLDLLDVDAALVIEPLADDPNVAHFRQRGLPVVTIGKQALTENPAPYVDLRSAETMRLMLDHLAERGAQRIVLVTGSSSRNAHLEGEDTYRAFADERGMAVRVVKMDEAEGEAGGEAAVERLLKADVAFDGLCVPVDAFAVGALKALAAHGRRVPEDVKVITRYDGVRAKTAVPALTAVDLHLPEVGQAGVELLMKELRGTRYQGGIGVPPATLLVRASTVPPPPPR